MIKLAAALVLAVPAAASAQDLGFNYVEGGFITSFVNDVENSGTITGIGPTAELETDAGGGGFIGGALEFGENMHVFGEFASASQELEVRDGTGNSEGEFDVVRWRVGVGYARPVSAVVDLYGRLSYDSAEFKDVSVAGFNLDADVDESGIGGEIGMTWAATPAVQLQGHLRYTSVGEIAPVGSDTFDSDILAGVNGRWYVRPDIALVAGYEFGKITTVNVGVRYSF
ncbi:MAG TPA: outer membrane beta-barrel protein [Arenimonas sp.]|nr:outer membrane beta-barrel protein [Arenimonas sp.]